MQPALVLGTTRATVKHPSLNGQRLLIVQPVGVDQKPDGEPLIVIDHLGAARGARVILTSDSELARGMVGNERTPVRWSTIGVIDQ